MSDSKLLEVLAQNQDMSLQDRAKLAAPKLRELITVFEEAKGKIGVQEFLSQILEQWNNHEKVLELLIACGVSPMPTRPYRRASTHTRGVRDARTITYYSHILVIMMVARMMMMTMMMQPKWFGDRHDARR